MKDPFIDEIEPQAIDDSDPLESKIQSTCVAWARRRGYWARKFSSPANRSVPDYVFARADIGVFFVEFKRLGKGPTEKQADEHALMRAAGCDVDTCDSVESFKKLVLEMES